MAVVGLAALPRSQKKNVVDGLRNSTSRLAVPTFSRVTTMLVRLKLPSEPARSSPVGVIVAGPSVSQGSGTLLMPWPEAKLWPPRASSTPSSIKIAAERTGLQIVPLPRRAAALDGLEPHVAVRVEVARRRP